MGTQERRERNRAELRGKILAAARELFATEGVERVSMRNIAARIEYSPKTLYLHFANKGELLYQLCEDTFRELNLELRAIAESGAKPDQILRRALHAYIRFGERHPNDYRIAFLSPPEDYPYRSHDELPQGSVALEIHARFRDVIGRGVRLGLFRRIDLHVATYVLWAGAHGVALALIADPQFAWVDRKKFIDQTVETLLRGLRK